MIIIIIIIIIITEICIAQQEYIIHRTRSPVAESEVHHSHGRLCQLPILVKGKNDYLKNIICSIQIQRCYKHYKIKTQMS